MNVNLYIAARREELREDLRAWLEDAEWCRRNNEPELAAEFEKMAEAIARELEKR